MPIVFTGQAHLKKGGLAPGGGGTFIIPYPHLPGVPRSRLKGTSCIKHLYRLRGSCFAAVPYGGFTGCYFNLVGCLQYAALVAGQLPAKARGSLINAYGINL